MKIVFLRVTFFRRKLQLRKVILRGSAQVSSGGEISTFNLREQIYERQAKDLVFASAETIHQKRESCATNPGFINRFYVLQSEFLSHFLDKKTLYNRHLAQVF